MGKYCWEDNQLGFLHPHNEILSSLPCVVIKGTPLDRVTYQMQSMRPTGSIGDIDWQLRKQNAQILTSLVTSFDNAQQNATLKGESIALDPNVYLQSRLPHNSNLNKVTDYDHDTDDLVVNIKKKKIVKAVKREGALKIKKKKIAVQPDYDTK